MKGILSAGIGGFGRGVVNWTDYDMKQNYGSLEIRGVRIIGVDGPKADQYLLPGEYQIDTSDRSKEFFQLHLSPVEEIKAIARGKHVRFISDWLSKRNAQRIPNQSSMNPRAGGGGSRATGHATFHLHADALEEEWREGLSEAVGYLPRSADATGTGPGGGQAIASLKFSAVGAMGAGMGLDNAHLIKSVKDEDTMLTGVIALPNAYDAVISDPAGRRKRDAKSMALLRELLRFQHADDFPTMISYTPSISVQNDQLFGLCFLIDGAASDLSLNDLHPTYGACAAVADLEAALILDNRHIIPDLPNWTASIIGKAEEGRRFAAFGVHSYIFPRAHLIETLSLRYARDLYEMLVKPPAGAEEEGRQLADDLLDSYCFTRLGLRLSRGEELPVSPPVDERSPRTRGLPQLVELINNFTVKSSEAGSFPSATPEDRILALSKEVKTRRFLFFPVHNQEVIDGCQSVAGNYIGSEDKPGRATVRAWIDRQKNRIVKEFEERLERDIKGVFYDPKTGEPVPLNIKPYLLVVARDCLLRTREVIQLLESEFKKAYDRWVDDEEVVENQRKRVEDLERELLSAGRNTGRQREYIRECQRLMELEIWKAMVKACATLAARLRSITDRWWREIGEPTQSWYSFFRQTLEHLDAQLRDLLSVRTDLARVKVRRYFPFPDDPAEQAMYRKLVEEENYHSELLRLMSFSIYSTRREKPGEASHEENICKLLLSIPHVQGYDSKVDQERMYDVVRERYTNLKVEGHSPYKIVQYGRNFLKPLLEEMHLPEAMLYDYEHCWRPSRQEGEGGPKVYAAEIAGALSEKSHVFFSQRPSGEGGARASVLKTFCLGHFRNLPNAEANSADELATLFSQQMEQRTGVHEVEEIEDMVICLNFELGVSIYDWAYYPTCVSQYKQYLRDPEAELIQLYPEEQNALELERLLEEERLLDDGYLSASVVKYLGDLESFSSFVISYALGLLDVKRGEMDEPDEYVVRVKMPGSGEVAVALGQCHKLGSVIGEYLAPGNGGVRAAVRSELRNYLKARGEQLGVEGVVEELRSAAEKVRVPQTSINHNDLRLAIQGALYKYIRTIESNQQLRAPSELPAEND